jgi:hypothetical protein
VDMGKATCSQYNEFVSNESQFASNVDMPRFNSND